AAIDRTFAGIDMWYIAAGKQGGSWKAHDGPRSRAVWHVAFSTDGKTLVSGGADKAIRVWDVSTGRLVQEIKGSTLPVFGVAPSPNGKLVASLGLTESKSAGVGPWDDHIHLWDVATSKEVRQLSVKGASDPASFAAALAFTPDSKTLAAVGLDGVLRFWDPASGEERLRVALDARAATNMLAFAPEGKTLLVPTNLIRLIDAATAKDKLPLCGLPYQVRAMPLTLDARTIATTGGEGYVQLWDTPTGRPRNRIVGHDGMITALRSSADGGTLFTTGTDRKLRVWDMA